MIKITHIIIIRLRTVSVYLFHDPAPIDYSLGISPHGRAHKPDWEKKKLAQFLRVLCWGFTQIGAHRRRVPIHKCLIRPIGLRGPPRNGAIPAFDTRFWTLIMQRRQQRLPSPFTKHPRQPTPTRMRITLKDIRFPIVRGNAEKGFQFAQAVLFGHSRMAHSRSGQTGQAIYAYPEMRLRQSGIQFQNPFKRGNPFRVFIRRQR